MDSNEFALVEQALNRIKKNPHAIEKYDAEKLFDLLTVLNQKYQRFAETFISTWELNKDGNFKGQDLETALKRQSVVKNIDKLYSIVETEYNKRKNNDTPPGPEIDLDIDAALKICLLKELGVFDRLAEKGLAANKMAQLIAFLTKEPINTGAVNVTLGRIQNECLMEKEKYKSGIANLKLKFGITQ